MPKEIVYQVGGKEQKITSSGTEILAEGIRQLQERVEADKRGTSTTEITLDKSNKVAFPGFPYLFEALGEKILVSIDVFKSGYECKECKGKKVLQLRCNCERQGHAGLKYSDEELETIKQTLGDSVSLARQALPCDECIGDFLSKRVEVTCPYCKGIGATLIIPDTSKILATTGVVVSMGSLCNPEKLKFNIGDRIVFGPYAGNMIPTRAGLAFKILDASQAWCRIEGGDDLSAFDFVIQDKE